LISVDRTMTIVNVDILSRNYWLSLLFLLFSFIFWNVFFLKWFNNVNFMKWLIRDKVISECDTMYFATPSNWISEGINPWNMLGLRWFTSSSLKPKIIVQRWDCINTITKFNLLFIKLSLSFIIKPPSPITKTNFILSLVRIPKETQDYYECSALKGLWGINK